MTVEIDVRTGLPAFSVVGLADTAVREARERVQAAIRNSGFEFPARRITASLAPADMPKAGPGLDLALACATLAASDQLPGETLERTALYGELGLDGTVRACRGALAVAQATRAAGLSAIALAPEQVHEASMVEGLSVRCAGSLRSAVRVLTGGRGDPLPTLAPVSASVAQGEAHEPDLGEVRGQWRAVHALLIAAAGGHSLLLTGPPGAGKTMLAQRLPSILPPLTREEAIEVMRIRNLAGEQLAATPSRRPFRAPHHTTGAVRLLGGERHGLGEAVLAHAGVLFLDELCEFSRQALEALRQPLEDSCVAVAHAGHATALPARFILLAASNPCPCGQGGASERCTCSSVELARYRRRLSGPLLDRIDLHVAMTPERAGQERALLDSRAARLRVREARERQAHRLAREPAALNAHMEAGTLERRLALADGAAQALAELHRCGTPSARAEHRVLRVARTIADLDASHLVQARHVAAAAALRPAATIDSHRA